MVRFEKDKFIVEVPAAGGAIESWLNTLNDLIHVLSSLDPDLSAGTNHFDTMWLLQNMLPEYEDAKKMIEK